MDLPFPPIVKGFLRGVDRALGGEQARVVAMQIGRAPARGETTAANDIPLRMGGGESWLDWQAIEAGRIERYRDMREGRAELAEWERAIQVRKGYCFNSQVGEGGEPLSFRLTFGPGARKPVVETCERLTERLNLHAVTPDIYDAGQWLGDSFDELVFDLKSRALVDLRHWEPERVTIRTDRATGRVAQYDVGVGQDWDPTQPIGDRVPIAPFLMLHYAPNRVRGQVYGRSMLAAGRKGRREYEAVNDMLVMSSLAAIANQYLLWPFPREANKDELWRWISKVRQSAELNLQFNKDGVLRRRIAKMIETSPKVLPYLTDPDLKDAPTAFQAPTANLRHLLDVAQWQQENSFIVSGVPAVLCGLERNVNSRATATEQSAQFAVAIMADQTDVAQDVLSTLYVRACMAQGMVPEKGEIRIDMFPPSQLYERMRADVAKAQAEACKTMVDAGIPLAFALRRSFNLVDAEVTEVVGDVQSADVASVDAFEAVAHRAVEKAMVRYGGRDSVTADAATVAGNQPPVALPGG